jgi:hypothetical protein
MVYITINVFLKFLFPEIPVGFGGRCVSTAFVPMPEATMDEYHDHVFRKHKPGGAWQLSHIQSIAESLGKKKWRWNIALELIVRLLHKKWQGEN